MRAPSYGTSIPNTSICRLSVDNELPELDDSLLFPFARFVVLHFYMLLLDDASRRITFWCPPSDRSRLPERALSVDAYTNISTSPIHSRPYCALVIFAKLRSLC